MRSEVLDYLILLNTLPTIQMVAEKCHTNPTTISKAISSLESDLEMHLVNRDRTGTKLTPVGMEVAEAAKNFFTTLSTIKSREISSDIYGGFSFPIIYTAGLLTDLLSIFEKHLSTLDPNISITLESYTYRDNLDLFYNQDRSYAFTYFLNGEEETLDHEVVFEPLITGCLYCQVSPQLISQNKILSMEDLLNYPLLLLIPLFADEDPFLKKLKEIPFSKVYFTREYMQQLKRIENGLGCAFTWLPDFFFPKSSETMNYIPISSEFTMRYGLLYHRNNPPCGADAKMIKLFVNFLTFSKTYSL